jgi:hypothetical protein
MDTHHFYLWFLLTKSGYLRGRANRDIGCDLWVRQIDRVADFRAVPGVEIVR